MSFEELIASYDPIDVKYRELFIKDCIPVPRKIDPKYMSFIPTVEEVEKIFCINQLKEIKDAV